MRKASDVALRVSQGWLVWVLAWYIIGVVVVAVLLGWP